MTWHKDGRVEGQPNVRFWSRGHRSPLRLDLGRFVASVVPVTPSTAICSGLPNRYVGNLQPMPGRVSRLSRAGLIVQGAGRLG